MKSKRYRQLEVTVKPDSPLPTSSASLLNLENWTPPRSKESQVQFMDNLEKAMQESTRKVLTEKNSGSDLQQSLSDELNPGGLTSPLSRQSRAAHLQRIDEQVRQVPQRAEEKRRQRQKNSTSTPAVDS